MCAGVPCGSLWSRSTCAVVVLVRVQLAIYQDFTGLRAGTCQCRSKYYALPLRVAVTQILVWHWQAHRVRVKAPLHWPPPPVPPLPPTMTASALG